MKKLLSLVLPALLASSVIASANPKPYDQVTAVDKKAKTITLYQGPKNMRTYTITGSTRVIVNNKATSFEHLKPGMIVHVSHKTDSTEADMIVAQSARRGHRRL